MEAKIPENSDSSKDQRRGLQWLVHRTCHLLVCTDCDCDIWLVPNATFTLHWPEGRTQGKLTRKCSCIYYTWIIHLRCVYFLESSSNILDDRIALRNPWSKYGFTALKPWLAVSALPTPDFHTWCCWWGKKSSWFYPYLQKLIWVVFFFLAKLQYTN
jgi:hypothetical protein